MRGIKNKDGGRYKRLAVFMGLFLVFGLLLNSVHKVYQKKKEAEGMLARMEKERTELEERSKNLEDALSRLQTKEGLDFEIRKRFNVAGAGEGVAIIVEEEQATASPGVEKSSWQKFKDALRNIFE